MIDTSNGARGRMPIGFSMTRLLTCSLTALVLFAFLSALPAKANAGTIYATVSVANLPTTITLCRDPAAYATHGVDEFWQLYIDVDNDSSTGLSGYDAVVEVVTDTSLSAPCTPKTADTQTALEAALGVWDASQNTFVDSGTAVALSLDFARSTMTVMIPTGGPLAGISASSTVRVQSVAPYSQGSNDSYAGDSTADFKYGEGSTDPVDDVQQCSAPCNVNSAYYPLVDLVSASLGDVVFRSSFE